MTESLPYSLLSRVQRKEDFYTSLSLFTDRHLPGMREYLGAMIPEYIDFIRKESIEKVRSHDEYLLEPLIAGVLWNTYARQASNAPVLPVYVLRVLYRIRRKNRILKPFIDRVRGFLMHFILSEKDPIHEFSLKNFKKLIRWLAATGEFNEEAKRLENWAEFLEPKSIEEQQKMISRWIVTARDFESAAQKSLGRYTSNVRQFTRRAAIKNRFRENRILCGRREAEYHLNMFAAEVMNRQFRADFMDKKNKIVLLPTCMRGPFADCRAVAYGTTIRCAGCRASCNINIFTKTLSKHNIHTSIIPHSSNFSRYLKNWENSEDTALVGIACVLNLLTGGYEMRGMNIASQCVFLDFSGCKKHWHPRGIATDLNSTQLFKILGIPGIQ